MAGRVEGTLGPEETPDKDWRNLLRDGVKVGEEALVVFQKLPLAHQNGPHGGSDGLRIEQGLFLIEINKKLPISGLDLPLFLQKRHHFHIILYMN